MADPVFQDESNFEGYVHKPVSKSHQEALIRSSFGKVATITKSAIQSYIASFLDSTGEHRRLFELVGAQFAVQYVTDFSYDPKTIGAPMDRHVQLARMFPQLTQKIPAILLIDGSVTPMPTGIGDWDSGFRRQPSGVLEQWIALQANVSLDIIGVGMDQGTAEHFRNIFLMIFGTPLRRLANGFQLRSSQNDSNWVVTSPLVPPSVSNINTAEVGDDPVTKFSYVTMSTEWRYEDVLSFVYKMEVDYTLQPAVYEGVILKVDPRYEDVYELINPDSLDTAFPMGFELPTIVPVGVPVPVPSLYERPEIEVYVDRPDRASIDISGRVFRGKQVGEVTLYAREKESSRIIASKTVTIVS
jgi:hypothetical protein